MAKAITTKDIHLEENTGLALLSQIENAIANQARILTDWENKKKPAIQCEEALGEFVKEIATFRKNWYEANFLSHYYMKIMLKALKTVTFDAPGGHLAIAATSIKLDKMLEEFVLETAEKAQAEEDEKTDNGKKYKPGKQMTLFDEMAEQGVTTILSLRIPSEQLPELVNKKLEEQQSDKPFFFIEWLDNGIRVTVDTKDHTWTWAQLQKGIPTKWQVEDELIQDFWGWILKQDNSPARGECIPKEHWDGATALLAKLKKGNQK